MIELIKDFDLQFMISFFFKLLGKLSRAYSNIFNYYFVTIEFLFGKGDLTVRNILFRLFITRIGIAE